MNNHAHVLKPKPGINIDYLSDYLESISLETYITGTYQRKLNKSECERIPVPVPPKEIQYEIADKINRIGTTVSAVEAHVATARELVHVLLQNSVVENRPRV